MKKAFSLFVLMSVGLATAGLLDAMPAFARKYQMSCKTCHAPFPKLKAYGDEFAANGFALKDKDAPRYFADTGDEKVSLLRDLPVAIRFEGYASFNNSHSRSLDFSSPFLIKLLSGGVIARNISYYLYFFFGEKGKATWIFISASSRYPTRCSRGNCGSPSRATRSMKAGRGSPGST
jgi:hypothetical protein